MIVHIFASIGVATVVIVAVVGLGVFLANRAIARGWNPFE